MEYINYVLKLVSETTIVVLAYLFVFMSCYTFTSCPSVRTLNVIVWVNHLVGRDTMLTLLHVVTQRDLYHDIML